MSHLHIPDGVLPLWLVALGWLLMGAILLLVTRRFKMAERGRQLPLLGVMAAVMLVGMSTEIVPIGYHTNLSVLAGIVLGPGLGFLAAVIVNLILALFGHGGITVVGLNSLVVGTEAAVGYYLFRGLWWLLRRRQASPAVAAGVATALTLVLSTGLMIGIVGLSNLDPSAHVAISPESLTFKNPFEHGFVSSELAGVDAEHQATSAAAALDLLSFAKLVGVLALLGWLLEAVLTGAIVGFVYRIRPDLVEGRKQGPLPSGNLAGVQLRDLHRDGLSPEVDPRERERHAG